jgi:hypothetical protein
MSMKFKLWQMRHQGFKHLFTLGTTTHFLVLQAAILQVSPRRHCPAKLCPQGFRIRQ